MQPEAQALRPLGVGLSREQDSELWPGWEQDSAHGSGGRGWCQDWRARRWDSPSRVRPARGPLALALGRLFSSSSSIASW